MTKKTKNGLKNSAPQIFKICKKMQPGVKFKIEIFPENKKVWSPQILQFVFVIFFQKVIGEKAARKMLAKFTVFFS